MNPFPRLLRRAAALGGVLAGALLSSAPPGRAAAPPVFAIRDARIVTVASPPVERGTVVIRDGLIEAVGTDVPIPADARVIDGKDRVVYPGLIDASSDIGLPQAAAATAPGPRAGGGAPAAPAPREEGVNLSSFVRAADLLSDGGARAESARLAGITTVLAVPGRGIFSGQSALVNLNGDRDTMVLRAPVAMHLRLASSSGPGEYPRSLMGIFAFIRQTFMDARHYEEAWAIYNRGRRGLRRPQTDRALEALQPVLQGKLPLVIPGGTAPEIRRALRIAEEAGCRAIISGAAEGWKVTATLREKQIPLLVSARFPERPRDLYPGMEESLRALQRRADAPRNAAELHKAGIPFAFFSEGMADPKEFVKNVAKAVKAGLPPEAALRALTLSPAEIFGVAEQLGSIEKGKIANLVVTDGDLFAEKTKVRLVFVDGKRYEPATEEKTLETPRVNLAGRWTATIDIGGNNTLLTFQFTQAGNDLTGTVAALTDTVAISEGTVSGREFRFKATLRRGERETLLSISGTVEEEKLRGKVTVDGREVEFTGARAPMGAGEEGAL